MTVKVPLLEEMQVFIQSPMFLTYVEHFPDAYQAASELTSVSIEQPGDDLRQLGRFYQTMWDALPDAPYIRHGAFYKICDFAEKYCYPDED